MPEDKYILNVTSKSGKQGTYVFNEENLRKNWDSLRENFEPYGNINIFKQSDIDKDSLDPDTEYTIQATKNGKAGTYKMKGSEITDHWRPHFDNDFGEDGWRIAPQYTQMMPRYNVETNQLEGFDEWRDPASKSYTERTEEKYGEEYRNLGREISKPEYNELQETDRNEQWRVPTGIDGETPLPKDTSEMWKNIDRYKELSNFYKTAEYYDKQAEIMSAESAEMDALNEWNKEHGARLEELEKIERGYSRDPQAYASVYGRISDELRDLKAQHNSLVDAVVKSEGFRAGREVGLYDLNDTYDSIKEQRDKMHRVHLYDPNDPNAGYYAFENGESANQDEKNLGTAEYFLQDAKNTLKSNSTYWGGWRYALNNPDTYLKLYGASNEFNLRLILDEAQKLAEQGKGWDSLSESMRTTLEAWNKNLAAHQLMDPTRGWDFNAAQSSVQSIRFMVDMAISMGITKAAGRVALEQLLSKGLLRGVERTALEDSGMTLARALGESWASTAAKKTGVQFVRKELTNLGMGVVNGAAQTILSPGTILKGFADNLITYDEDGNLPTYKEAFWNSAADNAIEIWSENGAEPIWNMITRVPASLTKLAAMRFLPGAYRSMSEFFTKAGSAGFIRTLRAAGFQGQFEEMFEELAGAAARYITGVNKDELRDFFTWDNIKTLGISFLPMTLLGGSVSMAQVGHADASYKRRRSNLEGMMKRMGYNDSQTEYYLNAIKDDPSEGHAGLFESILEQAAADGAIGVDKDGKPTITGKWEELTKEMGKYRDAAASKSVFDGAWESEQNRQRRDDYDKAQKEFGGDFLYNDGTVQQDGGAQFSAEDRGLADGAELEGEVQEVADEMADTTSTPETRKEHRQRRREERKKRREEVLNSPTPDQIKQTTIENGKVSIITTTDGRRMFVLGRTESGEWSVRPADAKAEDKSVTFISDDQIKKGQAKGEDGNAREMTAEETVKASTSSLKDFIDGRLLYNLDQRRKSTQRYVRRSYVEQMRDWFYDKEEGRWKGEIPREGGGWYSVVADNSEASLEGGLRVEEYDADGNLVMQKDAYGNESTTKTLSWEEVCGMKTGRDLNKEVEKGAAEIMGEDTGEQEGGGEEDIEPSVEEEGAKEGGEGQSAIERIPKDDKGNTLFESAETPALAWEGLVEKAKSLGQGKETALSVAKGMLADRKRELTALEKARKGNPKGRTAEEKMASLAALEERIAETEKAVGFWNGVIAEGDKDMDEDRRAEKERERRENGKRSLEKAKRDGLKPMGETTQDEALSVGAWTVDGYVYTRQETTDGIAGKECEVVFGLRERRKGRYRLVPLGQVQASHLTDGSRNPLFFIFTAQPKDRSKVSSQSSVGLMATTFDPEQLTDGKTAYVGAPVINQRGEVIQGNGRVIAMNQASRANMDRYRQWLSDNAERFGFTKEQVESMGDGVLVRELDVDDSTAISLGQKTAQDTESGGTQTLDPKRIVEGLNRNGTLSAFIDEALASDEDEDLNSTLRRNMGRVMQILSLQGLINETQMESAFDRNGNPTQETMAAMQRIVGSVLFEDGYQDLEKDFERLNARVKKAILQTVWRTNGTRDGKAAVRAIQQAIRAYREIAKIKDRGELSGVTDLGQIHAIIRAAFGQGDWTTSESAGGRMTDFAMRLAEDLYLAEKGLLLDADGERRSLKDDLGRVFKLMETDEGMFGTSEGLSAAEAFGRVFGYGPEETVSEGESRQNGNTETGQTESPETQETPQTENTQTQPQTQPQTETRQTEGTEQQTQNTESTQTGNTGNTEAPQERKGLTEQERRNKEWEAFRKGLEKTMGEWKLPSSVHVPMTEAELYAVADRLGMGTQVRENFRKTGGRVEAFTVGGSLVIYAPTLFDNTRRQGGKTAQEVLFHEVVGHIGLKVLMGEEKFRGFCGKVFAGVMDEAARARFLRYHWNINLKGNRRAEILKEAGVETADGGNTEWQNLTDEQRGKVLGTKYGEELRQGAADEYMAGLCEKVARGETLSGGEKTVWRRIMDWIRGVFGKELVDDVAVADAIMRSKRNIDEGGLQTESSGNAEGGEETARTQAEERGPSEKGDRIDDWGERIEGARKFTLSELAKKFTDATVENLVAQPLSKVFPRQDFAKQARLGKISEEDALVLEAIQSYAYSQRKPAVSRKHPTTSRLAIEAWAKEMSSLLQLMGDYCSAKTEEERRAVMERITNNSEVNGRERAEREQWIQRHNDSNVGDLYTPNPIGVTMQILRDLGYPQADVGKVRVPVIKAVALGQTYMVAVGGNYRIQTKTFDEALEYAEKVVKAQRGDTDIDYSPSDIRIFGHGVKREKTGEYFVKSERGGKVTTHSAHKTREEAESAAEMVRKSHGKDTYVGVVEGTKAVGHEYYTVSVVNPASDDFSTVALEGLPRFDTKEEAEEWVLSHMAEVSDAANEAVSQSAKKEGTAAKEKPVVFWRTQERDGTYSIAIKERGRYVPVARGFRTAKEANDWAVENRDRVAEMLRKRDAEIGEMERKTFFGTERPRKGKDWRKGKDVTVEEFGKAFGFRGVQFGNWTNQEDRQRAINEAYDAFMDLADVLGVSPQAMSLAGELGIAFGARGTGNANAHYESGKVVINLTKTRGAGSLAHEWWHALDNYFSRRGGVSLGMMTDESGNGAKVRDEVRRAFGELTKAVEGSEYDNRSKQRGSYWGDMKEETARLFAEWVNGQMRERGWSNGFLARDLSEISDRVAELNYELSKLGGNTQSLEEFRKSSDSFRGFAQPSPQEVADFAPRMRNIFDTIQERVEDGKTVLFSAEERKKERKIKGKEGLLDAVKILYNGGKKAASEKYSHTTFDIAKTPAFMKRYGVRGERFTISYGVISYHFGKDNDHNIPIELWNQLPKKLQSPFAITKYYDTKVKNENDKNDNPEDDFKGYNLYTTLKIGDKYVVVGVVVKNVGRNLEVNSISTVFGRGKKGIREEVIYRNPRITPEQSSFLNENNPRKYPTTQELSDRKGSENSDTSKENAENSTDFRASAEERVESIDDFDGREGTRFSVVETPEGRSLVGVHNITEDKLRKALKLGGLANPSVAVVDLDKSIHRGYGDISLLLPSEKIDADSGGNAGTWLRDAGTPRFPRTELRASEKGQERLREDVESLPPEVRKQVSDDLEYMLSDARAVASRGAIYLFLWEEGKDPVTEIYHNNPLKYQLGGVPELEDSVRYIRRKGLLGEYMEWLNSLRDRYELTEVLSDGTPATLDNISEAMKRSWDSSDITTNPFTPYPKVKTREEIRANRGRLGTQEDLFLPGNKTPYFETKFDRPVTLDEFVTAVVPKGTDRDIVSALKGAGLKVLTYKRGDYDDRKRAVKKAATEEVRFSAEERAAVDELRANGVEVITDTAETERVLDEMRDNGDTRFLVAGERSLDNIDRDEAEHRMANLGYAQDLEDEGKNAGEILAKTGWQRGADRLWRYEIGDPYINEDVLMRKEGESEEEYYQRSMRLEDVLTNADDLFERYPQLKDFKVQSVSPEAMGYNTYGNFDYTNNRIDINGYFTKPWDEKNETQGAFLARRIRTREILLHEVQHAIQEIEGFARGGNNRMKINDADKDKVKEMKKQINKLEDEKRKIERQENRVRANKEEGWRKELNRLNKEYWGLIDEQNRLQSQILDEQDKKRGVYNQLTGEVEARNVAKRAGVPYSRRMNSLLESTEDVARKDQIILRNGIFYDINNTPLGRDVWSPLQTSDGEMYGFAKDGKVYLGPNAGSIPASEWSRMVDTVMQERENTLNGETKFSAEERDDNRITVRNESGFTMTERERKEAADQMETVSDIENPADDDRFSAEERVATANEARERLGVELTPDDLASTSTKHGAMMKALRKATESGDIPGMDSDDLITFLADTYRTAPDEVKSGIWEVFNESATPDLGREIESALGEYVSREVRGAGLTEAQRTFLDRAAKTIAGRLGISGDNAKYVLWQHATANDGLVTDAERAAMRNALGVTTPASDYEAGVQSEMRFSAAERKGFTSAKEWYENRMMSIGGALWETLGDEYRALNAMTEAIVRQTGKPMEAWENPESAFNQMTSKMKPMMDSYRRRYYIPMIETINDVCRRANLSYDQIVEYVSLKHGLERNEVMGRRAAEKAESEGRPAPKRRDWAGVTAWMRDHKELGELKTIEEAEAEARKIVEGYEKALGSGADELWEKINAATKRSLALQNIYGLMSDRTYGEIRKMYRFYIPLQGFAEETNEDRWAYLNGWGAGRLGNFRKKAEGRSSKADDPFVTIGMAAQSVIAKGEENRARQSLLTFLERRPGNDLVHMGTVWYVATGQKDSNGRPVYELAYPPLTDGMTPAEAGRTITQWEEDMRKRSADRDPEGNPYVVSEAGRLSIGDGLAFVFPKDISEHCIDVYVSGQLRRIYINGNPRAAQAVNGTLRRRGGSGAKDSIFDAIEGFTYGVTRLLSMRYTSHNPEFFVTNFMRDVDFALANVSAKERREYRGLFRRNILRAMQIGVLSKRFREGKGDGGEMQTYYEEFAMNGGITGYSQMMREEDIANLIGDYIDNGGKRVREILNAPARAFQQVTEDGENLLRFAAYVTSRQMGRSITESVASAKDVTVNFNRKGTGRVITQAEAERLLPGRRGAQRVLRGVSAICASRPLYAFYNVAVQGVSTVVKNAFRNPWAVAKTAAVHFGISLLNGMIHGAAQALLGGGPPDPDDDYWNIPDYDRRNNFIITLGGGRYIKVPISQEWRPWHAIGDVIAGTICHKTAQKNVPMEILTCFGEALPVNPFGEGGLAQSLSPTFLTPVVDIAVNRDYRGVNVTPTYHDSSVPKWQQAYRGTADWAVAISRALNGWNDPASNGWRDLSPEAVQHIVEGYLGGIYTFANRVYMTGKSAVTGEELNMRNVPFVNRFYARSSDRQTGAYLIEMGRYAKGVYDKVERRERGYSKSGDYRRLDRLEATRDHRIHDLYGEYMKGLKDISKDIAEAEDERERMSLIRERNALLTELARRMEGILYE